MSNKKQSSSGPIGNMFVNPGVINEGGAASEIIRKGFEIHRRHMTKKFMESIVKKELDVLEKLIKERGSIRISTRGILLGVDIEKGKPIVASVEYQIEKDGSHRGELFKLGRRLVSDGIQPSVFVSHVDAWISNNMNFLGRIRDDPMRRSALVIVATSYSGESVAVMKSPTYSNDGCIIELKPWEPADVDIVGDLTDNLARSLFAGWKERVSELDAHLGILFED